ncbi:MAG: LysE family translocator [Alphaproteobacteria bacterium]
MTSLLAFVLAASLLAVTPGLDTAMVLRIAALEAPRRAIFAMAGIVAGCLVWGGAVALGLGALLAASETAYTALKWAGAVYLVWLGIGLIRNPRATLDAGETVAEPRRQNWFARGLLTNLLNPKIGIFYVSFLPQFVPEGMPVGGTIFLLAAIHATLTALWLGCLIIASAPLRRVLARPSAVRTMDRLAGGLFIAVGAKLALSRA